MYFNFGSSKGTTLRWGDFSGTGKVTKSAPNTYGFGNSLTAPISAAAERPAQRQSTDTAPAVLPQAVRGFSFCSLRKCAYSTLRREVLCGNFRQDDRCSIFPRALFRRIRRETLTVVRVTIRVDRKALEEPSRRRSLMALQGLSPVNGGSGGRRE